METPLGGGGIGGNGVVFSERRTKALEVMLVEQRRQVDMMTTLTSGEGVEDGALRGPPRGALFATGLGSKTCKARAAEHATRHR